MCVKVSLATRLTILDSKQKIHTLLLWGFSVYFGKASTEKNSIGGKWAVLQVKTKEEMIIVFAAEAPTHIVGSHSLKCIHAAFRIFFFVNRLCYVQFILWLISINGVSNLWIRRRHTQCRSHVSAVGPVLRQYCRFLVKGISYPQQSPRRHIGRCCLLC